MRLRVFLRGSPSCSARRARFVLESSPTSHLKAVARYLCGVRPVALRSGAVEFVDLNFDFHPRWMWQQLAGVGLHREGVRTVSHFRIGLLKRLVPPRILVALDALAQVTGSLWQLSPSVFVRSIAAADKPAAMPGSFFRCPACGHTLGRPPETSFHCTCGQVWAQTRDLRFPLSCRVVTHHDRGRRVRAFLVSWRKLTRYAVD